MTEFGQEVPKSMKELLEGTNISSQQMQKWGQDVAKGGEVGRTAMQAVAQALTEVDDETQRTALGVAIFGTLYEDQGANITETLLNMSDHMQTAKENQDELNKSMESLDSDPMVQLKEATNEMMVALAPLLTKVAEFIGKLATWASENPKVSATLAVIGTVISTLVGAITFLAPIIGKIIELFAKFGTKLTGLAGPIGWAIAIISTLISIGVALYKNWDTISQKAVETWGNITSFLTTAWSNISETASTVWEGIKEFFSGLWNGILETITTAWIGITEFFTGIWEGIKSVFITAGENLVGTLTQYWENMKGGIETVWNGISEFFTGIWDVIKNIFVGSGLVILQILTGDWEGAKESTKQIWENIKEGLGKVWEGIKGIFNGALETVKGFISTTWDRIKTTTSTIWDNIKTKISTTWENIKTTVREKVSEILTTAKTKFEEMKTAVRDKMDNVKTAIKNKWEEAKGFLKGIDLSSIGKNIIQGLINGIKSMGTSLTSSLKGIVDSAIIAAKNKLGIKSPSRVFMEIGKFTGEGFVIGMEKMANSVNKASQAMVNASIPELPKLADIELPKIKKLMEIQLPNISDITIPTVQMNAITKQQVPEYSFTINPAPIYLNDELVGHVDFNMFENELASRLSSRMRVSGVRV